MIKARDTRRTLKAYATTVVYKKVTRQWTAIRFHLHFADTRQMPDFLSMQVIVPVLLVICGILLDFAHNVT